MEMTPWDEYQWGMFKDLHPSWILVSYGDRIKIGNRIWSIDAASMELALEQALYIIYQLPTYYCWGYV